MQNDFANEPVVAIGGQCFIDRQNVIKIAFSSDKQGQSRVRSRASAATRRPALDMLAAASSCRPV